MRWCLPLLILSLSAPLARADAPLTPRELRKLFRKPPGSLSFGQTNNGSLHKGVEIPLKGPGYAFFSMIEGRKTHFATAEMAAMIKRAAKQVQKRYKGSVLGIGNVGNEEGGSVGESVSHQNGRDADLGIYAFNKRGKRTNVRAFVFFDKDGWDRSKRFRFDTERNLALVVALLTDPKAQVQWLFLAQWLEDRLIREAWAQGLDPALIEKMEAVLQQPGDSNPHADHLHLRIFCSNSDRLHGCLERGPLWDWVDRGDAAWEARVHQLARVVKTGAVKWQVRALVELRRIRGTPAADVIADALGHSDKRVRREALKAVRALSDPASIPGLARVLMKTRDPKWAVKVFRAITAIGTEEADRIARLLLSDTRKVVAVAPLEKVEDGLRRSAIRLLGWTGRTGALSLLKRELSRGSGATRKVLDHALRRLTNHPAQDWTTWIEAHRKRDWAEWLRTGFEARGYRFGTDKGLTWGHVPVLIEAVKDADKVCGHNASRALTLITGYDVDPRHRTPRNNQRLWRSWQRSFVSYTGCEDFVRGERRDGVGLEPAPADVGGPSKR